MTLADVSRCGHGTAGDGRPIPVVPGGVNTRIACAPEWGIREWRRHPEKVAGAAAVTGRDGGARRSKSRWRARARGEGLRARGGSPAHRESDGEDGGGGGG